MGFIIPLGILLAALIAGPSHNPPTHTPYDVTSADDNDPLDNRTGKDDE